MTLVKQYNTKLEERTLYEGYCNLEYGSGDSWITAFQFNLSNDGTQFTDSHTVYIYQSACQTFNNESGNVYFTLQVCYSLQMKTIITDIIPTSWHVVSFWYLRFVIYNWQSKSQATFNIFIMFMICPILEWILLHKRNVYRKRNIKE